MDQAPLIRDKATGFRNPAIISSILIDALNQTHSPEAEQKLLMPPRSPELRKKLIIEAITGSKDKIITEFSQLKEPDLDFFLANKLNQDLVPAFHDLFRNDPVNCIEVREQLEDLFEASLTSWGLSNLEPEIRVKGNQISRDVIIAEKKVSAVSSINYSFIKAQILYMLDHPKVNFQYPEIQEKMTELIKKAGYELNILHASDLTRWLEKQKPPPQDISSRSTPRYKT